MGVYRTDYLMWGAKIDPKEVDYDAFEAEIDGDPERRFDMVYDVMSGQYAIVGKIIARSEQHEGLVFREITESDLALRPDVVDRVEASFPKAKDFALYLFSHYH